MIDVLHVSGGPTKPEIIAVSLSKLNLKDGSTFIDIGCGTGAVSIEASKLAHNLRIYAYDARAEAIDVATQNFKNHRLADVTLLHGEASHILNEKTDIGTIDYAFIGGTKNIRRVLEILCEKKVRRIVVNAVRIETVVRTIDAMKELGIFDEVLHVAVSRGAPIAGETMFKPENPVYIIVGKNE
ncbi:MAG: precorrin-6Y C5,15-methyltransferase (decarboxylating) subunit CbiT [Methanosarcinaceae archaeon]|nr:precorrin-6Y C5,15-methyltransferase (decarboxylating) subunit CbiT [Methanosarcinaceae archaeon]MDF1533842.1 precorrin-6Y C5,15-methyltransferase (decarboxylating) subunit CbiT [Methanosarcinaceae archaeon]